MNDKGDKKVITSLILLFICMLVVLSIPVIELITYEKQIRNNEKEFGLRISDNEKFCYDKCEGHYLYESKTGFKAMTCICGNNN